MTARADTLQARSVSVDTRALAADVLDIAVTPDVTLRVALDRREMLPAGGQAWSGRVPGDPLSAVTLVSASGAFQGSIRTTDAAYSIEPDGPAYVVRQVDTRLTPPELEPLEPPVGAFAAAAVAADPPMAGDDGSTIDVLVLYTPGARASAGGSDAAVQARIALGVTETNTAYANSGITPRLRLVGTQVLNYTEVGMSDDLTALQSNASVGTLRNSVGADLVSLIVANSAEACGVGYLLNGNAAYGFSVTSYNCISPNYSFGHELGHNMGFVARPGGRRQRLLSVFLRLQAPVEPVPHGHGLRLPRRLSAGAALLEPEHHLQRRADRHRRPARQRQVDQQHRQRCCELPPGRRRRHPADDLGRSAT